MNDHVPSARGLPRGGGLLAENLYGPHRVFLGAQEVATGDPISVRKLPPALKCGGFPTHPAPLARGLSMPRCPVQANRAHARPTYLRPVFRLATELRVFSRLLRSPRLVSRGSSPGVPEPWYWLTFYAGSLPLPATAYVRRPDCTADRARRLSAFRFSTSLGGRAEAPGRRSSTATESGVDSTG